jgi:hypothetical protein
MLPTPTTTALSMMKGLTAMLRLRDSWYSRSPVNSSDSGSGPRWLSSGCSAPAGCQSMAPKRRGSV